uniref:Uncharacterized protein n=1 Tax=Amphimedon queenslandica TaxID=400682 RepID=A0A1X7TD10_AMPQE
MPRGESGLYSTPGEISKTTNPRNRIPGNDGGLENKEAMPPRPENKQTETRGSHDDQRPIGSSYYSRSVTPLGKFNSVSKAISPAPLFCRALQRDLTTALDQSNQHYDTPCSLSSAPTKELELWNTQLMSCNGKSLVLRQPDLQIESDASLSGWGASCQGTQTGGPWSQQE